MERISYARVLTEMDVTVPLPNVVQVLDPNGANFDQEIRYEWKPQYCTTCQIGHMRQVKQAEPKQREPIKTKPVDNPPKKGAQRGGQRKTQQVWLNKGGTTADTSTETQPPTVVDAGGVDAAATEQADEGWTSVKWGRIKEGMVEGITNLQTFPHEDSYMER
ncbi:uncharacterized protein LOC132038977 [Lycium ferocissimum]|uniref:uncharacterized protein LOC132038977 n=1 Tax=Lycium ferocissimum TaxID=112874 RepID=UPI002814F615|nr:uncharacterized protein LOC132038977 [Lycium ferocissimum]